MNLSMPIKSRRGAAAGLAVLLCAAGGTAIAANSADSTGDRIARGNANRPAVTPAEAANAFGVLRSDPRPVPRAVGEAFRRSPQYSAGFAPNAELGRALAQRNPYTGTEPWLVPGEDGLCLYVPDTDDTVAMTCNTLAEAKAGNLHLVLAPVGQPSFAVGVVPDGVTEVVATKLDGSRQALPVTANSYAIRSADVASISVGSVTWNVPQAPKVLPPLPSDG